MTETVKKRATLPLWGKDIDNDTMIAANSPKAYARTTAVVDLKKATNEDGTINFKKIASQYQVGDKLMFIAADDQEKLEDVLKNNKGLIFTIEKIENGNYTFAEGTPEGEGVYFIVLWRSNPGYTADQAIAMVPVTIEMLQKQQDKKLRLLGLKSPGWYRWRQTTALPEKENRHPIIYAELVVSMKNFHTPTVTGISADTFQPSTEIDPTTGNKTSEMTFSKGETGDGIILG